MDIKQAISAIRNNWPPSCFTMLREALEMSIKSLEAAESAQTAHNTQMAAIAKIAVEIERGAQLVASTDPEVVQCSMENWSRQLRHL
jgi:hypothetical protein